MLFLVVRTFVVEAFKIPTSSMEGTLLVGDFLAKELSEHFRILGAEMVVDILP